MSSALPDRTSGTSPSSGPRDNGQFLLPPGIQTMLDGLSEQVALIGCDGIIRAVNRTWRREVERQAQAGAVINRDYVQFLGTLIAQGDERVVPIVKGFEEVRSGRRAQFKHLYIGSGTFRGHAFKVVVSRFHLADDPLLLVSVHDVTELMMLKRQRRRLQSWLLRAQEDERRRIARELHDSTSQSIVALQLNVMRLKEADQWSESDPLLLECANTLAAMQQELRAFSFMCHPPSLTENGLVLGLNSLIEGFSARTGLNIDFLVDQVGGAPDSVEATIYRLAQEALTNIHRHAHATRVVVQLLGTVRCLHLIVYDNGVGFHPAEGLPPPAVGVGILGMKERLRSLGGRLTIQRVEHGTAVLASLPRSKPELFDDQRVIRSAGNSAMRMMPMTHARVARASIATRTP
jgi:two-component system NarL family sensor kinase